MRTTYSFIRKKSGRLYRVPEGTPKSRAYYAVWKGITAALWEEVTAPFDDKSPSPSLVEERIWKVLLKESNLLRKHLSPIHDLNDQLLPSAMKLIQKAPAHISSRLVAPLFQAPTISNQEQERIKRECYQLWVGKGAAVSNGHPLLISAVTGMMLKERYGIGLYQTVGEVPQRLMEVLRLVSSIYADIMDMNVSNVRLRDEAMKKAGLIKGPYEERNE